MDDLPLKDIHLPSDIIWWPPAPGWWLLLLLVILSAVLGIYLYRRGKRRNAAKQARLYLSQLNQIQDEPQTALKQLSQLLRRVAMSYFPREQVAGLHGEAWLAFLDQGLSDQPFQHGIGRCLLDSHYRPAAPQDLDWPALMALCERWLKQQELRQ